MPFTSYLLHLSLIWMHVVNRLFQQYMSPSLSVTIILLCFNSIIYHYTWNDSFSRLLDIRYKLVSSYSFHQHMQSTALIGTIPYYFQPFFHLSWCDLLRFYHWIWVILHPFTTCSRNQPAISYFRSEFFESSLIIWLLDRLISLPYWITTWIVFTFFACVYVLGHPIFLEGISFFIQIIPYFFIDKFD